MIELIGGLVIAALATFFLVVRVYERRLRAGELGKDWDSPSIFVFALLMGAIWPLTLTWALARRLTREERREVKYERAMKRVAETNKRAKRLGIGDPE